MDTVAKVGGDVVTRFEGTIDEVILLVDQWIAETEFDEELLELRATLEAIEAYAEASSGEFLPYITGSLINVDAPASLDDTELVFMPKLKIEIEGATADDAGALAALLDVESGAQHISILDRWGNVASTTGPIFGPDEGLAIPPYEDYRITYKLSEVLSLGGSAGQDGGADLMFVV